MTLSPLLFVLFLCLEFNYWFEIDLYLKGRSSVICSESSRHVCCCRWGPAKSVRADIREMLSVGLLCIQTLHIIHAGLLVVQPYAEGRGVKILRGFFAFTRWMLCKGIVAHAVMAAQILNAEKVIFLRYR